LLGRQLYEQSTVPGFREAIEAYHKAINLDPHYAEAYADLALAEFYLADQTGDGDMGTLAEQTAQKAVDVDPSLAIGYSTRGVLREGRHFDWDGAKADYTQALALEPTNSRALERYGSLLLEVGRTDEAVAMFVKAMEQDPLSSTNWRWLGWAREVSRDHAGAYDAFRHALAIRPASSNYMSDLAQLQLVGASAQEALTTSQSIISNELYRNASVAMAEHTLGNAKASQQALDKLIAANAEEAAFQIAEVYAWRGEKDKAFEWLERAYRQQDGGLTSTKIDLLLASLHSDPRYAALLRKLNFPP